MTRRKYEAKLKGQTQSFHACEECGQSVNRNICILENRGKSYKKLNTVGSIQFLKKWKIHDLDAYFWAIMQEKSFF